MWVRYSEGPILRRSTIPKVHFFPLILSPIDPNPNSNVNPITLNLNLTLALYSAYLPNGLSE